MEKKLSVTTNDFRLSNQHVNVNIKQHQMIVNVMRIEKSAVGITYCSIAMIHKHTHTNKINLL